MCNWDTQTLTGISVTTLENQADEATSWITGLEG